MSMVSSKFQRILTPLAFNYQLGGFSVELQMTFLTALDQNVETMIRNKPRARATGRITVSAA